MENAAATEAATIKKKRNRSQTNSKPKYFKPAERPLTTGTAEQAAVVKKENNPSSFVSREGTVREGQPQTSKSTPVRQEEETGVDQLARNPSRRRRRKPKAARETKENAFALESVAVEQVSPLGFVGQQYPQSVSQNPIPIEPTKQASGEKTFSIKKKTSVDVKKFVGIVDIEPHKIFPCTTEPVIRNVSVDDNINFGKLTTTVKPESAGCTTGGHLPQQEDQNSAIMSVRPNEIKTDQTREEILAEREAKKAAKLAAKQKSKDKATLANTGATPEGAAAKPTLSKAERRAIQEAQRAAKAEALQAKTRETTASASNEPAKKSLPQNSAAKTTGPSSDGKQPAKKSVPLGVVGAGGPPQKHIVNLFNHLHQPKFAAAGTMNSPTLHPAVMKLGIQYAEGAVVGSKARCLAMLKMLNQLIHEYETPPEKEFGRSFEEMLNNSAAYLQRCRRFSVSMTSALRHVKMYTRQLDGKVSDSEQKESLLESIESYIRDQIEKAEEAICISVQEKIFDGDVILTYGCSLLIKHILEEANRRSKNFRVIIVNARPREEEHVMLEQLVQQGVKCTYVLINAVSYVMPEVTKVLLGAHALLANGSVMSRVGTAQIALVAKSYNVPVLVCCETHKFTERVQTDAFVYNEIGNPNDLVLAPRMRDRTDAKPMLAGWETLTSLTILNLLYDVTPPELVTAVVTEIAILPCTSVPVILRMKPSDVAY